MEPHTRIKEECPFCHEQVLEVLTWPAHIELRNSRSAVAKSTTAIRKPEGFELISERCSNCGKTAGEIKRAWADGPAKDNREKRLKRLEELKQLGFSGRLK